MNIDRLALCQAWETLKPTYYHGDMIRDTIDVITETIEDDSKLDLIDEAMSQLPNENELDEIRDFVDELLTMNKKEMVEGLKKLLVMIDDKQSELNGRTEYANEVLS